MIWGTCILCGRCIGHRKWCLFRGMAWELADRLLTVAVSVIGGVMLAVVFLTPAHLCVTQLPATPAVHVSHLETG